jgi:RecB family exonuclease
MPELFDCPARWEAKHILGLRTPRSPQAHIGTSLHASTACFDGERLKGNDLTANETAGVFVDALHNPDEEVDWDQLDTKIETIEKTGIALHENYCERIAVAQNYTGVEIKCESLDIEFPDHSLTLRLTGSTDRVRKDADGQTGISDIKTGKTAVSKDGKVAVAKHGAQLAVYELLVEQATGVAVTAPAQIIGLATVQEARVGIGEIKTAREVLVGTVEQPGLLDAAVRVIKSGMFYGNPSSMLCGEKFCPVYAKCKWRF